MTNTPSLESATRKKIDAFLNNLGWITDEDSVDCNVFTERAKTKEQNKKFSGKAPDYVLYQYKTDTPIAVIEAKRKGHSIEDALIQGIEKYAKPLGVDIVFATDGTFVKSYSIKSATELSVDKQPLKEFISEKKLLRFIEGGGVNIDEVPPEIKHSRDELIRIFEWANNLLRKEGLRNLDRFVEFANILFIKIISEIEADREATGLGRRLSKDVCWESFADEKDSKKMLNYINNTVLKEGLAKEYNHTDDIFQEQLKIQNPETIKQIVNKLSGLQLLNTESEIKGDAFEYFLKSLASGNDLGEYFTPRHIVRLMVHLIKPKFGNTIFDPFCGTGGFLIEGFRFIKTGVDEKDTEVIKRLTQQSIFGIELTDTYKIAKMNMIITGDGHNNIVQDDSAKRTYWDKFIQNETDKDLIKDLQKIKKSGFDVVFSNIPYSQKTDYGAGYPVPSNNGDSIFIQAIILSLSNNGKCAVIVPEGFLFRKELKNTRKYLMENCSLDAIISLPSGVFMPYTGVKTDILIFTKGTLTKSVYYFKIENDGFELNTGRKRLEGKNDIDILLDAWKEHKLSERSWIVDMKEIENNNFNLIINNQKSSQSSIKIEDSKKLIENAITTEKQISAELSELKSMI